MIISFHFLICVQLTKTTLILKRREYILELDIFLVPTKLQAFELGPTKV